MQHLLLHFIFCARVVELVDTLDLKSNEHCARAGSSPAPGTHEKEAVSFGQPLFLLQPHGNCLYSLLYIN